LIHIRYGVNTDGRVRRVCKQAFGLPLETFLAVPIHVVLVCGPTVSSLQRGRLQTKLRRAQGRGTSRSLQRSSSVLVHLRKVLGSNLDRDPGYREWSFSWFSDSLQPTAAVVARLGHDRFLPHPLQFIIRPSSHNTMLWSLFLATPHGKCVPQKSVYTTET
jgi:hypothetical protein